MRVPAAGSKPAQSMSVLATENGRTIQTKQTIGRNEPVTLGHAAENQLSRPLEFQIN
jgi:hypothetical protein